MAEVLKIPAAKSAADAISDLTGFTTDQSAAVDVLDGTFCDIHDHANRIGHSAIESLAYRGMNLCALLSRDLNATRKYACDAETAELERMNAAGALETSGYWYDALDRNDVEKFDTALRHYNASDNAVCAAEGENDLAEAISIRSAALAKLMETRAPGVSAIIAKLEIFQNYRGDIAVVLRHILHDLRALGRKPNQSNGSMAVSDDGRSSAAMAGN